MKKVFLFLTATVMTVSAMAKTSQENKPLEKAIQLLTEISEEQSSFQVTPDTDVRQMIKELALSTGYVELPEDFDAYYSENNSEAWYADSMAWSSASVDEAESYISEKIPELVEFRKEQLGHDITGLEQSMRTKTKQAFAILRSLKSVKYGAVPMGGVQCGVRFPALLVIDTETGKIKSISMDGSGC